MEILDKQFSAELFSVDGKKARAKEKQMRGNQDRKRCALRTQMTIFLPWHSPNESCISKY